MSHKVLLVDGMALLFRHFYATSFKNQFMYNNEGVPTNGVQGTIRHIFKLIDIVEPEHVIVAWDMGEKTVRNDWYERYKSNRVTPPDALIPQFSYVKEVLASLNIHQVGVKGYEADDLIGTFTQHMNDTLIVSGDRDLLQLINESNEIWLTKKGYTEYHEYHLERFKNEYNILPEQFVDVKSLMGDSSDGYPGVKGIGEKTALKLIQTYGSVDKLKESLDQLTPSLRKKIETHMESLDISYRLAKIITDVPIDLNKHINESKLHLSKIQIFETLKAYDLRVSLKYINSLSMMGRL